MSAPFVAVVAGLCGGPGVCPGANIGKDVAIFEQVPVSPSSAWHPHSALSRVKGCSGAAPCAAAETSDKQPLQAGTPGFRCAS